MVSLPTDPQFVPASDRAMSVVEVTQVGLMWRVARQKFGLLDEDSLQSSQTTANGNAAMQVSVAQGDPKRKVKVNQVLDQADEAEVPGLGQGDVDSFFRRLASVRVVDLGLAPYADFALFVSFQHRFNKSIKFLNHVLQADGSFVEVSGPSNFDSWISSWRVFENTLLMLTVEVSGVTKKIVSLSALDEYREALGSSGSMALVGGGGDFGRLKRKLHQLHLDGLAPSYNPAIPWESVFREAAKDRVYWDRHVREAALIFMASKGKKKEQPGGTGAATRTGPAEPGGGKSRARNGRGSQKERLRKRLTHAHEDKHTEPPPRPFGGGKGSGSGGKSKGPKRDSKGKFVTDREGRLICFAYNGGGCERRESGTGVGLLAVLAGLTKAVAEICTKVIALGAEDKRFGEDLTNDNFFVKMFDLAKAENVTWIHTAPPCRTFTRDHHGTAKRLLSEGKPQGWGDPQTEDANKLAERCAAFAEQQCELGRWFSVENPADSFIWDLKCMARLRKQPGVVLLCLDQRAF
ncbi:unnamed protein product, partial [Effrenium voratum]